MPLPPRNDPLRPLLSSARSARGIGILQICLGFIIVLLAFFTGNSNALFGAFVVSCIVLVAPGACSMILAHFIERSRRWALVGMMVLASLEMLIVAYFFARGFLMFHLISMGIGGVLMAAFVTLIVQLARGFAALHVKGVNYDRGFAPIMPAERAQATMAEGSEVAEKKTE
jgi:hypothetical protein